ERQLVFDVNDFDETLPGPWEWDVKRLGASMLIAAVDNGFSVKPRERIVLDTVRSYRSAMQKFAAMNSLQVWYAHLDIQNEVDAFAGRFKRKAVARTDKELAKARTRDSMTALSKLTRVVDGKVHIVDKSPLIVPLSKLAAEGEPDAIFEGLQHLVRSYRNTVEFDGRVLLDELELRDVARKVVGVGSVGTRDWIALMMGRDGTDPLFLQIKEADASVLEPLLGPSEFPNNGQRVIAGQRLMQ